MMKNNDTARILIVDDQIHALHGVSRIMRGAGYETFEASNGTDCLNLAAEHKPDLILLDVVLPDIDGREVCRRIKSYPETSDIFVILLSSVHIESDSQAEGLEHGADGYIARPIPNRELLARVKAILRLKYAENRWRESEERYRRISSLTSDIAYSCIKSNNTVYSIDWIVGAVERITGHSEEDIKALGCWRTLVIDEDLPIFDAKVNGISPGMSASCELRLCHKSGKIVWASSLVECVLVSGTPASLRLYGGLVDITERKMAEEVLRISEDKFSKAFYLSPDAITITRLNDGMIVSVNDGFEKIFGYVEDELISNSSLGIDMWDNPEDRNRWTEKLKNDGKVDNFEACFRTKDGDILYGLVSAAIVTLNGVEHILTMGRDITERKRMEESLAKTEKRYRLIAETIHDCFWMTTPEMDRTVYVSPAYEKIWGRSCESLYESPGSFPDAIHPDDRDRVMDVLETHISQVTEWNSIYRIVRPDGAIRWIEDRGFPVMDDNGKWYLNVGAATDITERKKIEEQLQRNENKYQKLFQNAPLMYVVTRSDQGIPFISDCNKLFLRSVGFSRENVIGKPLADFYSLESRTRLLDDGGYALALAGEYVMGERQLVTRDGGLIQTLLYTTPETDYSGNITGTRAMFVDITAQRKAEEAQRRLATAIEQAAEGVVITDPKGTIQYVNPAEENISGYTRDELIGHGVDIFKSDKHTEDFYSNMWAAINSGKVWSGRFVNKRKDGAEYHEDNSISPVYDKSGMLTNFVAVKHDVTKQVMLQEQLFQSQKMEAIGTLAGGFAHDFNNKLQVIDGYVDLILFNKDLPDTVKSELEVIRHTVDISAELIQGMMVFSRKTPVENQPVDLNRLVGSICSMLTQVISKTIDIELFVADDLWAIKAAPNQIDQILMNLAINAKDAMPDGGKLTIKTKNVILDENYCRVHHDAKPGRYVLIEVSDTGTGMDKETASHIFEPFFTTKEKGKGTGLGLSVVYGIVEQYGGRIICDSKQSVGTTFRLYFQAIEDVHEEEYFEKKEPHRGQGETILLVDDEPGFLELAGRTLNRSNYRVIKASNGKEALNLYEKHRAEIRLVIMDLLMPEMDGRRCLEALRKVDPNVRVLIASGALNSEIEADLKEIGAKGLIAKPFSPNSLRRSGRLLMKIKS